MITTKLHHVNKLLHEWGVHADRWVIQKEKNIYNLNKKGRKPPKEQIHRKS